MEDDTEPEQFKLANDNNGAPDADKPSAETSDKETWDKIDRVALTLARIIGRRIAREDFERLRAANDNRPVASERPEGEADKD
jgi:hypothetical protein